MGRFPNYYPKFINLSFKFLALNVKINFNYIIGSFITLVNQISLKRSFSEVEC